MQGFFSNELQDLIRRMLCVDPISRITIEQIQCHPWVKSGISLEFVFDRKKIIKLYNNEDVKGKVLKQVLSYPVFKEYNQENSKRMIEENRKCYSCSIEGNNLSATFNILWDLELKSERSLKTTLEDSARLTLNKSPLNFISEKTTAGSSCIEETEQEAVPHSWVFGFVWSSSFSDLYSETVNFFKQNNWSWGISGKSIYVKTPQAKIALICYKDKENFVFDCALVEGHLMSFFEVVSNLYNFVISSNRIR